MPRGAGRFLKEGSSQEMWETEPSAFLGEAGRSYPADLSPQTGWKGPLYLKKHFTCVICVLCVTLGVSHGLMCAR